MVTGLKKLLSTPLGLLPFMALFVAEVLIVNPVPFELYATTFHGWAIGFIAFLTGYCFVLAGDPCRTMLVRWRWLFVAVATALFAWRIEQFPSSPVYLIAIESNCWVFSVLAFGARYLNRAGRALSYLSAAAYPVYILHMAFISAGAMLLFPLSMDVSLKFFLLLAFTIVGCLLVYEFLIRRLGVTRFLFGLRPKRLKSSQDTDPNNIPIRITSPN
jgi:membrane-bound acyltransferase YfiQ involved in biofilm formation